MRYVYIRTAEEIVDTTTGKTVAGHIKQKAADSLCKTMNGYQDGINYVLIALGNHKLSKAIKRLEGLLE